MPKRTIEIPEGLAGFGEAVEAMLKDLKKFQTEAAKDGAPVDFAAFSEALEKNSAAARLELKRRALQELDVDAERITSNQKPHARVGRYEAAYFTKEGPVTVMRSLYRECGQRNAKTVDAISLRAGAVDGWLPDAAKPAAFLLQQGTSREAESTARALGVLPYSPCSFERVAYKVGEMHALVRADVEKHLIADYRLPARARARSVAPGQTHRNDRSAESGTWPLSRAPRRRPRSRQSRGVRPRLACQTRRTSTKPAASFTR